MEIPRRLGGVQHAIAIRGNFCLQILGGRCFGLPRLCCLTVVAEHWDLLPQYSVQSPREGKGNGVTMGRSRVLLLQGSLPCVVQA